MQLKTSKTISFFDAMFRNKYNFKSYISLDEPTIFLGVYTHNDLNEILRHRGIKIVWFTGHDVLKTEFLVRLKQIKSDIFFIAESNCIKKVLDLFGFNYESISLFFDNPYNWKPIEHGNNIYWYGAKNSKYGKKYYSKIKRALPDFNIIILDGKQIPREDMYEIYKKCFVNIRLTDHDGFSQTNVEMGLMGRYSISNEKTPFSIGYNDANDVVDAIKRLKEGYNYKLISKRTIGFLRENESKWTDFVLKNIGTKYIDFAGIFNEDFGRCASIFRIMRTDVVNSLPKMFGTEQFERPYISEQLQILGLKELITSKNSGFIASEWKALNNKGYASDFKEFYTYDKKYS
jgi:hypothetical protein